MSKNTILSEIPNVDGIIKNVGLSGFETAIPDVDYQLPITLTTEGTTGAASLIDNVLNVPLYQGTSGTAGSSGTSGTTGTSGSSGTTGTSGATFGTSGTSGTSGSTGTSGATFGTAGTSGSSGVSLTVGLTYVGSIKGFNYLTIY